MLTVLLWLPLFLPGQQIIERVEIEGNRRIPKETILYYFGVRSGYPFDPIAVEKGLEALWSSGFFEDIKIAVRRGKSGQVVFLRLDEYPIVRKLVFETKKIKERNILERLRKRNIGFTPYSVYDPQKVHKIRLTIAEMLADEGYDQAEITFETIDKGSIEVDVLFQIREGRRSRIGEIVFEGNPKLERNILLNAFQNNREHSFFAWIKEKDIFRKAKLDEDLESLEKTFREHGYAGVKKGNPLIEEVSRRTFLLGRERMKKIIVPVDAGVRYFMGNVEIKGHESFTSRKIRTLVHLEKGSLYNGKIKIQSAERIKELYRNSGYFFVQVFSTEYRDARNRTVDVTFDIREGEKIYLNRLQIAGNTFTEDAVLRREMRVVEQEKFCLDLFTRSLKALTRSGMAQIEESPEIQLDPEDDTRLNISLKVVEVYRNEWQLTGGYSGYQGAFLGGNLSVVNFLGAGEKLDLMLEYGERFKDYMVGFFKPYIFDRPLSFSFSLFNRDVVYPDLFNRKGKGVQVGLDVKIEDYWRAGVGWSVEQVDAASRGAEESENAVDHDLSMASAFLLRNSVDDPFFPSKGMRFLFSFGFAASGLGSDIQYIKPEFEGALFFPSFGNHVFGLGLEYRSIRPFAGSEVPFWERFYLGGERSIRGYDVYSIGPRDPDGRNRGGEESLVFNIEYFMPVSEFAYIVSFLDGGNVVSRSGKIDLTDIYWSSGLEVRLRIPELQAPVRLIFAYNNRLIEEEDSHFAFRLAFGASF